MSATIDLKLLRATAAQARLELDNCSREMREAEAELYLIRERFSRLASEVGRLDAELTTAEVAS